MNPPPELSSAQIDEFLKKLYQVNPDKKQRELTVHFYGSDASFARFKRSIAKLKPKHCPMCEAHGAGQCRECNP
jgi:hypothetical protein